MSRRSRSREKSDQQEYHLEGFKWETHTDNMSKGIQTFIGEPMNTSPEWYESTASRIIHEIVQLKTKQEHMAQLYIAKNDEDVVEKSLLLDEINRAKHLVESFFSYVNSQLASHLKESTLVMMQEGFGAWTKEQSGKMRG